MGKSITLTAVDGFRLSAYRADPAGDPRGAVVVAQEIFGVNSHIKSVCDGFARDGYLAIAPALFDRNERNVDIGYTAEDIARGRALKAKATTDAALQDIAAARDALGGAGKVGIVGDCRDAKVRGDGAFRRARFGATGRWRQALRRGAPRGRGVHLRRRSRIQLRSARILRCGRCGACPRAHAATLSALARLRRGFRRKPLPPSTPAGSRPGSARVAGDHRVDLRAGSRSAHQTRRRAAAATDPLIARRIAAARCLPLSTAR